MPKNLIRYCYTILLIVFAVSALPTHTKAQTDLDKERIRKNNVHNVTIKKFDKADMKDDGATVEATLEFDRDGNMIKYTNNISNTDVFTITRKYENGLLISSKDTKNGKPNVFEVYHYDEKNKLSHKTTVISYDKQDHKDTTTTAYEYNENGSIKLTRVKGSYLKDFGDVITEYSYDNNGNETSQIRKNKDGGVEMSINKMYDEKNKVIDYNIFNGHDFFMHTTYEYDSSGALIKNTKFDENGAEKSEMNYKNDANGLVQISIFFDEVKHNWLYRKYTYTHY